MVLSIVPYGGNHQCINIQPPSSEYLLCIVSVLHLQQRRRYGYEFSKMVRGLHIVGELAMTMDIMSKSQER